MRRLLPLLLTLAAPACTDALAHPVVQGHMLTMDGGLVLGVGGTEVLASIKSSGTIDFANIVTLSCLTNTQTMTGAAANDPIACSWPAALADGLAGTCWISATNTVSYRLCNVTIASIDPASGTFAARVIR